MVPDSQVCNSLQMKIQAVDYDSSSDLLTTFLSPENVPNFGFRYLARKRAVMLLEFADRFAICLSVLFHAGGTSFVDTIWGY